MYPDKIGVKIHHTCFVARKWADIHQAGGKKILQCRIREYGRGFFHAQAKASSVMATNNRGLLVVHVTYLVKKIEFQGIKMIKISSTVTPRNSVKSWGYGIDMRRLSFKLRMQDHGKGMQNKRCM